MELKGAGSFVGAPIPRIEDPDLLRGRGTYVDNLQIEGVLHVAFVRSPLAHAEVRSIDVEAARAMPGVVDVRVAADLPLAPFSAMAQLNPMISRPPLATERVRFVGDIVAVVLAESKAQAVDAAELVDVDYEPLPAVVGTENAVGEGATLQFEELGSNVVSGARAGSADPLEGADVVVRARIENQRLDVVPMETSAIAAVPGGPDDEFLLTVYIANQGPHSARGAISSYFSLDPSRVRIVTPHVGGSFGGKHLSVEGIVTIALALEHGRPAKFVESRSESMVALPHGRAQVQYVELGTTRDGCFVGMRCRVLGDAGAYAGFGGSLSNTQTRNMAQGAYKIPKLSYECAVVGTNTTPMGAYRGAGRPEAAAMVERMVDLAAAELGMDPVELRRRNFVPPDEFPFTTLSGAVYDSGDFDASLTMALEMADYAALREEQARRRADGDPILLGIGVSVYVEVTAYGGTEYAKVSIGDEGGVTLSVGTSSHGQGHATTFAAIVADELGITPDDITFVQSDTALVPRGMGTGASRSAQLGGAAVLGAAQDVVERARPLAAELLEAAPDDIVVVAGGLGVAGVPVSNVSWGDLARAAAARDIALTCEHDAKQPEHTFPFGAHVAVVEVDTDTGQVRVRRHVAVDDCGRILNPLLADGQVHGGLASGIAQALWEQFVYDDDGNPLTTTLAEYAIPSAAELLSYDVAHTVTPTPLNPLGAKGIGESSTVGSTPAVQNAVVDALAHLGVRHLDMPCTPERVWRAVEAARAGTHDAIWSDPPDVFASLPSMGGDPHEAEDSVAI
jgi:carbon-monoxide dehydrogenase large subunit